ncbi:unnamed protein product [Rhizophagus irregularis]|nr:unnamed protein product [Rhizophagus irregularis]
MFTQCINRYIDTNIDKFETIIQFDQNAKIKITCPVPICNKLMERNDIKKIATKKIYERYDFLTFKLAIQKNPRFRWCQSFLWKWTNSYRRRSNFHV